MEIRSFIAVNLSPKIKEKLAPVLSELKRKNARVLMRWVHPKILHLTLHFLGSLDERKLAQVEKVLANSVQNKLSFYLEIDKLDCFPNPTRPRVLFISCRELGGNNLINLQSQLGRDLKKIGIDIDTRPWRAHITIGRVKQPTRIQLNKLEIRDLKFEVKSIDLMKSDLLPTGPKHTILKSFYLEPL